MFAPLSMQSSPPLRPPSGRHTLFVEGMGQSGVAETPKMGYGRDSGSVSLRSWKRYSSQAALRDRPFWLTRQVDSDGCGDHQISLDLHRRPGVLYCHLNIALSQERRPIA